VTLKSGYPSGLTASAVAALIDHYWNPDYAFVSLTWDELRAAGLIEHDSTITGRGLVFVQHILNLPLPVQQWKMPTTP
jgi:hypothetical protein